MEIGSQHAHLIIKESKAEDVKENEKNLEFIFTWVKEPVHGVSNITKDTLGRIVNKLDIKERNLSERDLRDIGEDLWLFLPERPENIRRELEEFDAKAKRLRSFSDSKLMLTIVTDSLDIPWELTVTGSDRGKNDNEHWFQRYLLGRELIDYRTYERPEKVDMGKRQILVIYEPFNLETAEKNILKKIEEEGRSKDKEEFKIFEEKENAKKSLKESKDCNDNLENLISRINTEKDDNIHIKPYRFPFDFNALRRDTMGEEIKYDLILYIGSPFS